MKVETRIGRIVASRETLNEIALYLSVSALALKEKGNYHTAKRVGDISEYIYKELNTKSSSIEVTYEDDVTVQTEIGCITSSASTLNSITLYLYEAALFYKDIGLRLAGRKIYNIVNAIFVTLEKAGLYSEG